mmetsp:Transcript_47617/g.123415  ORF Transcript_47617/g.123415 Transcript_47617/m.123415 type:complete len:82 (+) Transcript_47617:297-542(+)
MGTQRHSVVFYCFNYVYIATLYSSGWARADDFFFAMFAYPHLANQGWERASAMLIRFEGSTLSMREMRSFASELMGVCSDA